MQNTEKTPTRAFIDYKPAELRQGKDWLIVFYCKNPLTNRLERFRYRVPVIKSITERKKTAKIMLDNINKELHNGWTPFLDATNYSYIKLIDAQNEFLKNIEKEIKDGIKRADTLRTYKSNLRLFEDFFKDKIKFILEFKKINIVNYLDYLYNTRNNSPRTYNNQISFLTLFFNWCIEKSYIKDNPTKGIVRKKNVQKKRTIIDDRKTEIFEYVNNLCFYYFKLFNITIL